MAERRLNKKVVVGLTLAGFAVMLVLSIVMLRQLQKRDPKYFVDMALQAEAAEEWPQAALFYREAWQRGREAQHLVKLGEMLLHEGDVLNARRAWQQALIAEPSLVDGHLRQLELHMELARLHGALQDWEQIKGSAEGLLKVAAEASPEYAMGEHALGIALLNLATQDPSHVERGMAALQRAAEAAPHIVEYGADLARWHVNRGDVDTGEALFKEIVDRHAGPDALPNAQPAQAHLAYARFLGSRGRHEEAGASLAAAVQAATPDSQAQRDARLAQAVYLMQQWARAVRDEPGSERPGQLFAEAEQAFKVCIEGDPDGYEPYIQLSTLYQSASRHESAVSICEERLRRGLSRKGLKATRHRINTVALMLQASQASLSLVSEAEKNGDEAAREQWLLRAQQYVTDARGESPGAPAVLTQSGRVKVARGQFRAALSDLRSAEEAYAGGGAVNWSNKTLLARVHLALDEPGAARTLLDGVVEQAQRQRVTDTAFWTVYAQTLFQTDAMDRALFVADQILQSHPTHEEAVRLKAAIYERQGRRAEAGTLIEGVTGDNVMVVLLAARQAALDGQPEEAVRVLHEALAETPAETRLVAAIVNQLYALGRVDEARSVAERALQEDPDNTRIQRMAVILRPDLSDADREAAVVDIIRAEPDGYRRSLDLMSYHSQREEADQALDSLNEALGHLARKDTPMARMAPLSQHRALLRAKISLANGLGRQEDLRAARDEAVQFNVDGAGGRSLVGMYHLALEEYESAANAFRETVRSQPTDAWSLTQLGQTLLALGRTEEARQSLERALRVNPNEPLAHRGLAYAARLTGDETSYERHLAHCERLIPNDPWVAAELMAQKEKAQPHEAIARREGLRARNPEDVDNLQRLVVLYESVHDYQAADTTHRRLLDLQPDVRGTVVNAAAYFRRTGRPDQALPVLEAYVERRTEAAERAEAELLIAAHHRAVGDPAAAERTLLAAIDRADTPVVTLNVAEFYLNVADKPSAALPFLHRSIEKARAQRDEELARLLLARVACLLDRSVNDLAGARRDLNELRSGFPDDPRSWLWESELHAREGRIDEAIRALGTFLDARPMEPFALFQRAKHQVAKGRLALAIADLEVIRRQDPLALSLEPRLLLATLQRRVGRNDLWLHELESLVADAQDDPRAVEALVNAYLQERRAADADRLVTARINRHAADPQATWFVLRGRISLDLGDHEKALNDLRQAAELDGFRPERLTSVLDVYLRMGRYRDGVSFYEQRAPKGQSDPGLLARYAALLAGAGQKDRAVDTFRLAMNDALTTAPEVAGFISVLLRAAFPGSDGLTEAIGLFTSSRKDSPYPNADDRILVRLYIMAGRADEAVSLLDRLAAAAGDSRQKAQLLHEKGELLQVRGDMEAARRAYEEALKFDDQRWVTLNNLAYILADEMHEHALALPYARKAVELAETAAALDTLGWIYVGLGDYSAAIAELSRSVRQDPNEVLTQYHLGEAYRRNGQFGEAVAVLQSGLILARASEAGNLVRLIEQSLEQAHARNAAADES